jgi:uncharacterized protein YbjT (DUF2867 family)
MSAVFVTGGTGYIGRPLIARLVASGYRVRALTRAASQGRLPAGAQAVTGDALDGASFRDAIPAGATFIHLVGTPHPNPAKAAQFRDVDLVSIQAAVAAATHARVAHFIYVSVAHPAPVMREYIAVRLQGEALIRHSGIAATIVRPWYVLGPGHRWPYVLIPIYALLRWNPATRALAVRLGLVTLEDMVSTLLQAAGSPCPAGTRTIDVPEILAARKAQRRPP